MIVDLPARYVSPFGTGMSSNSLRAGFVGADAHAPRSRTTSSVPTSLCGLMPGAQQATQGTAREFGPPDRVKFRPCEGAGGTAPPSIQTPPAPGLAASVATCGGGL